VSLVDTILKIEHFVSILVDDVYVSFLFSVHGILHTRAVKIQSLYLALICFEHPISPRCYSSTSVDIEDKGDIVLVTVVICFALTGCSIYRSPPSPFIHRLLHAVQGRAWCIAK
jgi:hypothetical protein